MSEYAIGIDLGTSTSVVSFIQNGRPVSISDPQTKTPIVPSVVALNRRGDLVAGQTAIDDGMPDAKIREAKRHMGETAEIMLGSHSLLPEDVAALVLKKIKDNAEIALGTEITKAVITVPAYFDDLPRKATERAARKAGIEPIRLISEPVAAALAYGLDRLDDEGMLLVFDFGGGTLDVTVIDMLAGVLEVKATDGDKALGGKDMDELLIEFAVRKAGLGVPIQGTKELDSLKKEVERAKKTLSSQTTADIYVPSFQVTDGNVIDLDIQIDRAEFESLIAPLITRALDKVQGSLEKAKVSKSQIQRLLLVGGTCYIPRVREAVESFFALKGEPGVDPDLAVSMGAAISAGLKSGAIDSKTSVIVQDAATFRMGTGVLATVGDQLMLVFSELMPANAAIPFVRTKRYHLLSLDQDTVEIDVLQDRSGKAALAADAIPTGAIGVIKDIAPSTTDEPRAIDIEFKLTENQTIEVTGKVIGIDRMVTLHLFGDQARLDPLQSLGGPSVVETLWEKSPLASRNASLIKRTETLLATKPPHTEVIEAALVELKSAIAANQPDQAQDARERLTDLLANA